MLVQQLCQGKSHKPLSLILPSESQNFHFIHGVRNWFRLKEANIWALWTLTRKSAKMSLKRFWHWRRPIKCSETMAINVYSMVCCPRILIQLMQVCLAYKKGYIAQIREYSKAKEQAFLACINTLCTKPKSQTHARAFCTSRWWQVMVNSVAHNDELCGEQQCLHGIKGH